MKTKRLESIMATYLSALGFDLKDPNFRDTPRRVVQMHLELLEGVSDEFQLKLNKILRTTFPCTNDNMVTFSNISASSLCPHHLAPVKLTCWVAYIPKGKNVVGISKIPRLVELLAKKPVLQEDLTEEIADTLEKHMETQGVMVIMKGLHSCMNVRGVKSGGHIGTSAVRGLFREDSNVKAEAMRLFEF